MENTETLQNQLSEKTNRIPRWLIALVSVQGLVIFGLLTALAYFSALSPKKVAPQTSTDTQATPIQTDRADQTTTKNIAPQAFFVKGNEGSEDIGKGKALWSIDSSGKQTEFSQVENYVFSYKIATDHTFVAYIESRKTPHQGANGTYYTDDPIKVWYQPIDKPAQAIYTLEPITKPDVEYTLQLRDLSISPDNKHILFSTSDSIYMYDIDTAKLNTLLSAPVTTVDKGTIYAYTDLHISPNNKQLIYTKNFYEGGIAYTMDLASQQSKEIPLENNHYGTRVFFHWLTNDTFAEIESGELGSDSPLIMYNVLSAQDFSKKKTVEFPQNTFATDLVFDDQRGLMYTIGSSVLRLDMNSDSVSSVYDFPDRVIQFQGLELSADGRSLFSRGFEHKNITDPKTKSTDVRVLSLDNPSQGFVLVSSNATL